MSAEPMTLEQIQADPKAVIQGALKAEPTLWWGGFFHRQASRRMAAERGMTVDAVLAEYRRETLEARGMEQLLRAATFIAQAPRIQSLNRKRSTYGWKHVVERWHRQADEDVYVGEGAFLIAARAMGLTILRNPHGQHFVNLSETSATEANRRDDELRMKRYGTVPERIRA